MIEKETLVNLVNKLVGLGEDAEELRLWQEIFDHLEQADREKLVANLTRELERLTAAASGK